MLETQQHTVLIVEDVDEISSHMNEALAAKGHRILTAKNAQDAIQTAERDRPILILTDIDLPTFGLLVQSIDGHSNLNDVPVVIIDLNHPSLGKQKVKVVANFEELDTLIQSLDGWH